MKAYITRIKKMDFCRNFFQLITLSVLIAFLIFFMFFLPNDNSAETVPSSGSHIIKGSVNAGYKYKNKALPIYCVENDNNTISISFDAAWGADDTLSILDTLDKLNVKATFFMTGGWVESYPDMVKEIYSRGHDLGNHSENHKQMSTLNTSSQTEEIDSVTRRVKELTGYDMFLFRPPYGDYNNTLIETVYSLNYYPIQWDVDSLDWKDYGIDSIIKTVTKHPKLGSGSIVLMHNGAKYTAQALESVITGLQEKGYRLVPVSELIIRDNFSMDVTGRQLKNNQPEISHTN